MRLTGFQLMAKHFYNPIPDVDQLDDRPGFWESRKATPGIDFRIEEQLELLKKIQPFRNELSSVPTDKPSHDSKGSSFYFSNDAFSGFDAEIYYCFIRHFQPKRVVEIGSGWSTRIAGMACLANHAAGTTTRLTSIEPYPNPGLKSGFPGLDRLIQSKLEDVPMEVFTELEYGDILFIDSTHVTKTGGDVLKIYLEILPLLRPGVLVHAHDIFLPYEYPREWIVGREWYWTEQYLLQAFLAFNSHYEVLLAAHLLHREHADGLKDFSPLYDEANRPASFWCRSITAVDKSKLG